MSSKVIVGIVLAIVAGGGIWFFSSNKIEGPVAGETTEENQEGSGVLSDLIMRTGSWKCTVTTYFEEAPSTGTVYVADGKVHGDFVSKPAELNGKEIQSSMIQADGYVYTWLAGMQQGMKMKVPSSNDPATSEAAPVDYTAKVDYDCDPWMADASKFIPPEDVSFMELGKSTIPEMPSY